jgi:hypothetical protein
MKKLNTKTPQMEPMPPRMPCRSFFFNIGTSLR